MTIRRISLAILATAGLAGAALAQPNDSPNMVPGNEAYYAEHPWERYQGPYNQRWFRERDNDYRRNSVPGAGPSRDLRIGQRLPGDWRSGQYMVNDWRGHRLFAPPAGYRWYQVGADYVLVDSRGVIAQSMRAR